MNVGSNSAVIVNRDDVMIVDSHISPESGRAMLQELKAITDKPVRFLINTHFHYDHTNGNQAFPPGVDIIGHEFTRRKLTGDILEQGHVRRSGRRRCRSRSTISRRARRAKRIRRRRRGSSSRCRCRPRSPTA